MPDPVPALAARPAWMTEQGWPVRDHPTIERCQQYTKRGNLCPSWLNHDGHGGVYCPEAATNHAE